MEEEGTKEETSYQEEDSEGEGVVVEDMGMCQLKPQKLDFANISEVEMSMLDFDSQSSRRNSASSYDTLNIVQEIEFSSQSSQEWGVRKSPDMFASQE